MSGLCVISVYPCIVDKGGCVVSVYPSIFGKGINVLAFTCVIVDGACVIVDGSCVIVAFVCDVIDGGIVVVDGLVNSRKIIVSDELFCNITITTTTIIIITINPIIYGK